ncbi:retinoic acid early transcript 1E-like [Bos taurus]|uniref:MHC class I-like antigen recognition-like domain-containing protein n=1 Tax=Bos taurus TaxID=9913 RepID=A0AAA9TC47_BOVIN|nr:retinoic acid early transcript 1E-like [Bos taurus]
MSLAHTAGHLLLILLLIETGKTLGNAHSLCLDLTVKFQSRRHQPWCQVQGSVDTKPFLQYDSASNKVKPLGFLGKEVNDMKAWTEISQTLVEAGKQLRMVLPVIKLDKNETRGPPTLQVKLCCQCEAEQCSGASLNFSLNGRTALLLDTMSITWTVIDPGATGFKEKWEHNQKLAEYFRNISTRDCSYWLREFLKHGEKMLVPEPTEPLIMAPDISQSASIRLVSCIILLIITQLVLIASSS